LPQYVLSQDERGKDAVGGKTKTSDGKPVVTTGIHTSPTETGAGRSPLVCLLGTTYMKSWTTPPFVKYALIWYSEQFAVPFWVIGHVHLHLTDYHATAEAITSMVLHVLVGLGFWFGWQRYREDQVEGDQ